MIYNDEQFALLEQALPHFESVKKEYIRNAPAWLTNQIIEIYETATKKKIFNKDIRCAVCVMNIYKLVGKTYYEDKKERENMAAEIQNVTLDKDDVTTGKKLQKKSKKK